MRPGEGARWPRFFSGGLRGHVQREGHREAGSFGSDRVGGDSRVVSDPTFELARRSWKLRSRTCGAADGLRAARRTAAAVRSQAIVPSLTRGGVKYGMLVRRCSVVNAPRDRPPRDDRPPSLPGLLAADSQPRGAAASPSARDRLEDRQDRAAGDLPLRAPGRHDGAHRNDVCSAHGRGPERLRLRAPAGRGASHRGARGLG